jgi:hypothetical protein
MNTLTKLMKADLLSLDTTLSTTLWPLLDAIRARHPQVQAMALYGSCRRQALQADSLVDILVVVSHYRDAITGALSALANRALPPNVHYLELADHSPPLRCKYAVISMDDFARKVHSRLDSYFWARFTQPTQLLWQQHPEVLTQLAQLRAQAALNFWRRALALHRHEADQQLSAEAFWLVALSASYQRELRPEPAAHTAELVAADADYWQALTIALQTVAPAQSSGTGRMARYGWALRRLTGPALNLLRLLKAASTFKNGIDYLSWKIQRHSGKAVEVSPFMRRHPRLAVAPLAWQLWRQRGLR